MAENKQNLQTVEYALATAEFSGETNFHIHICLYFEIMMIKKNLRLRNLTIKSKLQ